MSTSKRTIKTRATAIVAGILLLLVEASGCFGSAEIVKPGVGFIPQGWSITDEQPYGTFEEYDGTKWGCITCTDADDLDFVEIFYGDIPPGLVGQASNSNALISEAIDWATTFEPEETGTMTVAGQLAGYAKAYDGTYNIYEIEIAFVMDTTCIDIYAGYDATAEDEEQVMSLIASIE